MKQGELLTTAGDGSAVREIERITREATRVQLVEASGITYSDRKLHDTRVLRNAPEVLRVHTLQALVDYIKCDLDTAHDEPGVDVAAVHIYSPTYVRLIGCLHGEFNQRYTMLTAEVVDTELHFGQWRSAEELIVELQARYVDTPDRAAALKILGGWKEEAVATYVDDGYTQEVAVRAGVAGREARAAVPNPVTLRPYRTFREVEQPASPFVLRLRTGQQAALYEADGGAWQLTAIASIRKWLTEKGVTLPILG